MGFPKFIYRDVQSEQPAGGGGSSNDGMQNNDNSGGTAPEETPSWIDVLPDEAKNDPAVTKYKTPEDFYKGYKNTVEIVGRKGVIVPKDDASPEEQAKFYNAIGRPEKPEGYKFDEVKDLTPALGWSKESDAGLAKELYDAGASQKTAAVLRNKFVGMMNQAVKDQEIRHQTSIKNAETALRQEWGNEYTPNLNVVARGIMRAGGQEAMDAMGGENGLGSNPVVLRTLAKVFKGMSEDQMKALDVGSNRSGSQGGNETKEQALEKIKTMNSNTADKNNPLWNENHPMHDAAVEESRRLYKIAHSEGAE